MTRNKLLLTTAAAFLGVFSTAASAVTVFGVTATSNLVSYDSSVDTDFKLVANITGFTNRDSSLIGIDFRVQDGLLYGVGNNGGVYTISTTTGVLTFVNALSVPLEGTSFGVDFNPAANRLRIVSNTGQNLRHDASISTGVTLVDDVLDYAPGTPLNTSGPTASGITSAAYTNNDLDATTGTTLFVVDSNLDQVALQSPPNNGSLVATGRLGVDVGAVTGFDILTTLTGTAASDNAGYFVVDNGKALGAAVYTVSLLTGRITPLFTSARRVVDIALPLGQ